MRDANPRPALGALIILGARLNPRGEPGRVAKLRLRHALKLWREHHPDCRIILSGGRKPGAATTEARSMADWSLTWVEENWGPGFRELLEPCLLLEEASLSTAAAAANTLALVQGLNPQAVGLVTDVLHLHRAHFLFKRHFYRHGIALHPLPAPGLLQHYWRQRQYLRLARMALREGGAWLKVAGRLALERWPKKRN
jgi:uncharacterized SAM-binding protein YcdF (DUF218 family)